MSGDEKTTREYLEELLVAYKQVVANIEQLIALATNKRERNDFRRLLVRNKLAIEELQEKLEDEYPG